MATENDILQLLRLRGVGSDVLIKVSDMLRELDDPGLKDELRIEDFDGDFFRITRCSGSDGTTAILAAERGAALIEVCLTDQDIASMLVFLESL